MTGTGPKTIRSYISGDAAARAQQAEMLRQSLAPLWQQVVGPDIAAHSHPLRLEGQCLLVHTDSSLWANQIRHRYPDFVKQLQQFSQLRKITELRVRVVPPNEAPGPERVSHPRPTMSSAASEVIAGGAKGIHDESLRAALLRLSRRPTK
ncbi:MAG: DUF721 domain-containing protein [Acidiferrobacterales bacterium]